MDLTIFYINLKLLFKVCCVLIVDLLLINIVIILIKTIYNNVILGNKNKGVNKNFKLRKLTKEEKENKNGLH